MIDSRGQRFGTAVAAFLDVRLRLLPGPEIHPAYRTLPRLTEVSR
jgi:hypothetical protein